MRLFILVSVVAISGLSQGMLLPLISILLENHGVSSSINGVHATAMYIGILLVSPFMEKPMRKYGYKPMIILGGFIVLLSLALFPLWKSLFFWFILRFVIGIGDHMLHFAVQTWITDFSLPHRRGRNVSLYGLSFGIGFAIGPMIASLVEKNEALPFFVSSLLSVVSWAMVFLLQNERPEPAQDAPKSATHRFAETWKYAWTALLLPFTYGFLEASIHGIFPVYALREHLSVQQVATLLPAFSIGSILFQLPLGMLSDRFERKRVLVGSLWIGVASFISALFFLHSIVLFFCFFVAGMFVGSLFSLGITYMADLLPKHLLPAGNLLSGILYSIGSMCGPFFIGWMLQYEQRGSFFLTISSLLFFVSIALFYTKRTEVAAK
ncbi:MFS transporter [Anoxybacteroides amylolyticum]|uniref:Sugar (And other) transporter family protein n=1 Tax=Anoxybacteroides amylolyticum TaxID=294699 RepID=A0A160F520_9BACL|nr:MFS transporter [Anoxybacillus amylolyticus]ANB60905.1 sugar (and other) transporter family protein [Anoxybacillus amylolyticus]